MRTLPDANTIYLLIPSFCFIHLTRDNHFLGLGRGQNFQKALGVWSQDSATGHGKGR